jgi:hypothetical protein
MVTFLIGASLWVVEGWPGPRNLFHVVAIDIGSICVIGCLARHCRTSSAAGQSSPWFSGDSREPRMRLTEERDPAGKISALGASALAAVIAAGLVGAELVAYDVLPGQQELDQPMARVRWRAL